MEGQDGENVQKLVQAGILKPLTDSKYGKLYGAVEILAILT
jgi:hypothetical protein